MHIVQLPKFFFWALLVVLVGAPGSGKSEFCRAMVDAATTAGCDRTATSRWSVVCQDELKSREACISSCEELLGHLLRFPSL